MMFATKIGINILHKLNIMLKGVMNFLEISQNRKLFRNAFFGLCVEPLALRPLTLGCQKAFFTMSLALCPVIFLTGCITLFPDDGKHPQKVVLSPSMQMNSPSNDGASPQKTLNNQRIIEKSIAISKPTAATFDESNRMVIYYDKDNLHLMDHIAGTTYQDNLPDLVQRHMVETLIASKQFRAIGFDTDSFQKDFILELDIQQFAIFAQATNPRANVTVSGKLLTANGRKPLWQKVFSSETPLKQNSLKTYVAALNQAYANVLREIIEAIAARK